VKVVVEIVSGARAGRRLEFDDPAVLRFGRHPSNDVAFDPETDRDASSRHAELRLEGESLFVYDLGSANGTRLGGRAVTPRTLVPPGTEVEFGEGGPRCRIVYDGPKGETVPPTVFRKPKPALPTALPPGTRVGARTVALMIDQAMARARGTSRRLQMVAVGLGVLLFLTLAGVVVAYSLRPPADVALRREMVKVMEQQRSAAAGDRAELQKKLDELQGRLAKTRAGGGSAVARANHDVLYLVTVKTSVEEEGFCTAFAVKPDRLVTNAHCVAVAEDYKRHGGAIWVVQNGHPEVRYPITHMKRIAGFAVGSGGITPDVGWLKLEEPALKSLVTLAAAPEYQALGTGDPMYTYGFPGRLADVSAPEATFVEGVVGRITALDGRSGDAKQSKLIQHSAFTSGGTSGSPIFNALGHVVAVNTGGYAEASVSDSPGKPTQQVVSRSLPGYNFGMRVDLVEELLSEADE
jgi:V8-like Glu-specific endopeptidase